MASQRTTVSIKFSTQDMLDMSETRVIAALENAKRATGLTGSSTLNVVVTVKPGIDSSRTQRFLLPTMEDVALFTRFMKLFNDAMRDLVGAYPPDCEAYTTELTNQSVCGTSCLNSDAELYNELLRNAAMRFMELTGKIPPGGIFSVSAV